MRTAAGGAPGQERASGWEYGLSSYKWKVRNDLPTVAQTELGFEGVRTPRNGCVASLWRSGVTDSCPSGRQRVSLAY